MIDSQNELKFEEVIVKDTHFVDESGVNDKEKGNREKISIRKFVLQNGNFVRVTPNHVMLIVDENGERHNVLAELCKQGQLFLSLDPTSGRMIPTPISSIEDTNIEIAGVANLITRSQTVVADNIVSSVYG